MPDKDYKQQLVDRAWADMQQRLDAELPQRRRRRLPLWWLLPVSFLLLGCVVAYWYWAQPAVQCSYFPIPLKPMAIQDGQTNQKPGSDSPTPNEQSGEAVVISTSPGPSGNILTKDRDVVAKQSEQTDGSGQPAAPLPAQGASLPDRSVPSAGSLAMLPTSASQLLMGKTPELPDSLTRYDRPVSTRVVKRNTTLWATVGLRSQTRELLPGLELGVLLDLPLQERSSVVLELGGVFSRQPLLPNNTDESVVTEDTGGSTGQNPNLAIGDGQYQELPVQMTGLQIAGLYQRSYGRWRVAAGLQLTTILSLRRVFDKSEDQFQGLPAFNEETIQLLQGAEGSKLDSEAYRRFTGQFSLRSSYRLGPYWQIGIEGFYSPRDYLKVQGYQLQDRGVQLNLHYRIR